MSSDSLFVLRHAPVSTAFFPEEMQNCEVRHNECPVNRIPSRAAGNLPSNLQRKRLSEFGCVFAVSQVQKRRPGSRQSDERYFCDDQWRIRRNHEKTREGCFEIMFSVEVVQSQESGAAPVLRTRITVAPWGQRRITWPGSAAARFEGGSSLRSGGRTRRSRPY